jgi:hypothetical protein
MIKIIKSASKTTKNNYIPIIYSSSGHSPWFAIYSKSYMHTKSSLYFSIKFNSKSRARRSVI